MSFIDRLRCFLLLWGSFLLFTVGYAAFDRRAKPFGDAPPRCSLVQHFPPSAPPAKEALRF